MSEIYNYIGAICRVSGNPCGTDTHAKGFPCQCDTCRAVECIAELEAELERTTNAIHQYMQTTSQRGPKRALVENFVGMYTYKARTTSAGGEG